MSEVTQEALMEAAKAAAEIYGESLCFLESNIPSRSRIVATLAIKQSFTNCRYVGIARKLGFCGSAEKWRDTIVMAKSAKWFREEDVESVVKAIRMRCAQSVVVKNEIEQDNKKRVYDESQYEPGARFVPRRRLSLNSILVPAPIRPLNVTASMCGDPPPGRRELIASIDGKGYRASNDDSNTTFARKMRRRRASQRAKENQAN